MKYVLSLILVCAVLLFVDQAPSVQYSEKNAVSQPDSSASIAIAFKKVTTKEKEMVSQATLLVAE